MNFGNEVISLRQDLKKTSHRMKSRGRKSVKHGSHACDRIPTEVWRQIACWLSRPQHQVLMQLPHVLGKLSSELFYRDIVLYYGTFSLSKINFQVDDLVLTREPTRISELDRWHATRCRGILSWISEDPEFALRVRTLKVYASGPRESGSLEMDLLAGSISRLKKLERLSCHGTQFALAGIIANLHDVPQLKHLDIRHFGPGVPSLPFVSHNLESLCIEPPTGQPYLGLLEGHLCLRKLRLPNSSTNTVLVVPLLSRLTNLELYHTDSVATFPFEVTLRDGIHLESLLIEGSLSLHTPSIHFRRYSHSLPNLKRFAISFRSPMSITQYDNDLFPAICDFLRNKSSLLTLKLVAPNHMWAQQQLGFDRRCWDLLPALHQLRALSMTLTSMGDSEHCAQFIPRSVTTLALWGNANFPDVFSLESQAYWPNSVRFLELDLFASDRTARKIATFVRSVYVVHLPGCHYNVVSRAAGKPPQVERWTRRTEEYFWSEQLEAQGCEDRLLYMFPPSGRSAF